MLKNVKLLFLKYKRINLPFGKVNEQGGFYYIAFIYLFNGL
jgi:hypothetical protein